MMKFLGGKLRRKLVAAGAAREGPELAGGGSYFFLFYFNPKCEIAGKTRFPDRSLESR
jgi:hypothetical protein